MQNTEDVLIVREESDLRGFWRAYERHHEGADPAEFGIERRCAQVRFHRRDWPCSASARLSIDGQRRTYPVTHGLYGLVVRPDR
ncbi:MULTISPECIES: hypothetical protein [Halomonadaceae]|uniref:Uncharacterized protein n=1 Tax=Vreelandella salicampi TaxID=1449798 RepID=A0A7Z0RVN8_9GAMM|nr:MULTISPECIES: hypothetical protein [Halomonas]MCD1652200.1 hypothetical protein [Halomonas axialensis]MCD2088644.1 hypothetical protein [Halomonas meridiana]MCO7243512.1 hypothetical protein [Halomonas sp. Ps84H-12]NYS61926.1 hypothetical protein [Halomonas salicampi]